MTNSSVTEVMMAEFYRFRTAERLLGKHAELERQTIFFAAPEALNDPMEGLQDVVWVGDQAAWQNLFEGYADFLHWYFYNAATSDPSVLSDPGRIPYKSRWRDDSSSWLESLHQAVLGTIREDGRALYLANALATARREVRRWELILYVKAIHDICLEAIREAYIRYSVISADEWPYTPGLYKAPRTPMDVINQSSEREDPTVRTQMILMHNDESVQLHLALMDSYRDYPHLMSRAPNLFVEHLLRLMKPEWYTACFTTNLNSSSMWGHYGGGHRGAALIFRAEEFPTGPAMSLKGTTSPENGIGANPGVDLQSFPFHRVHYGNKLHEIDFFQMVGDSSPDQLGLWHTDIVETAPCADNLPDAPGVSHKGVTSKTQDWDYEHEYRLLLRGPALHSSGKAMQTFTYDFMSLSGIIFGMGMSHENRKKIEDVIRRKCIETGRTWFEYGNAYYSARHGEVRHTRFSVTFLSAE